MPLTIPDYIEIRTKASDPAAYLSPEADGIKDCWIDQRLNAECTFGLIMPLSSEKWTEITAECRLRASGKEFVVLRPDAIDSIRDGKGALWGKVTAQESWILLDKQYPTVSNDPVDPAPAWGTVTILSGGSDLSGGLYTVGTAAHALYALLSGSGWTLATCDVIGSHDLETEKESRLANIQKVQGVWGGYFVWDSINKTVSLRAETWQNYTGFQVRYGKNLKHITRTANYALVTRLYPFGEDDLDISSVNGGVKYLENFSYTSVVYEDTYQKQEIADAQELKDKGTEVLAKICQPRYTYQVAVVDIRILPEYNHEDFSLGDMVDIIDADPGFNARVRIVRHKYNIFQPWKCELEIGEPEDRLAAQLSKALDASDYVTSILKPNPGASNLLKGLVNTFATQINSANGKLVWSDSTLEAIEIDGSGNETGNRVKLTPGGLGISTDYGASFATAITGSGVLASAVVVNELYALSTEDEYTQVKADGLHVYDGTGQERVHAGHWDVGGNTRFGLRLKNAAGAVVFDVSDTGDLTFSGALNGATGTFSGSLSGASGTFSGSLSAATGTFSGELSAATGSFSGIVLFTDQSLIQYRNDGTFKGIEVQADGTMGTDAGVRLLTGWMVGMEAEIRLLPNAQSTIKAAAGQSLGINSDTIITGDLQVTGSITGTVSYATSAGSATSATSATTAGYAANAGNADTTDGQHLGTGNDVTFARVYVTTGAFKYNDTYYFGVHPTAFGGSPQARVVVDGGLKASWASLPKVRLDPDGNISPRSFGVINPGAMQPLLIDLIVVKANGKARIDLDEKFLSFVGSYTVFMAGDAIMVDRHPAWFEIDGQGDISCMVVGIQKGQENVLGYDMADVIENIVEGEGDGRKTRAVKIKDFKERLVKRGRS